MPFNLLKVDQRETTIEGTKVWSLVIELHDETQKKIHTIEIDKWENGEPESFIMTRALRWDWQKDTPNKDRGGIGWYIDHPTTYLKQNDEAAIEVDLWLAENIGTAAQAWANTKGRSAHEKMEDIKHLQAFAEKMQTLHGKLDAYREAIRCLRWKHEQEIEAEARGLMIRGEFPVCHADLRGAA